MGKGDICEFRRNITRAKVMHGFVHKYLNMLVSSLLESRDVAHFVKVQDMGVAIYFVYYTEGTVLKNLKTVFKLARTGIPYSITVIEIWHNQ